MIQHSELVNFRPSPHFTHTLAAMAQREGVTRSELIRLAVSDRATLAAAPPPPINIAVRAEPAEGLHFRAANGDGPAFADLACLHYQQALNGFEPAPIALAKAIVFGRLAAVHPERTRQDLVSLLFLLDQQAETLKATPQRSHRRARPSLTSSTLQEPDMNLTALLGVLPVVGPIIARAPEFIALYEQTLAALNPADQDPAKAALADIQADNDAGIVGFRKSWPARRQAKGLAPISSPARWQQAVP